MILILPKITKPTSHVDHKALGRKITILSASQTGTAKRVAQQLLTALMVAKLPANLISARDYQITDISTEDIVLLVSSTHNEGDPPDEAIALFQLLHGDTPPNLSKLSYAVLALGDSSYPDFCHAGKLFDEKFTELGANRLLERIDCDLDFETPAIDWIAQIVQILTAIMPINSRLTTYIASSNQIINPTKIIYTKDNPCVATLLLRQKISTPNAHKDIYHLELHITDSLQYQVGDSLGIWFVNDPQLVDEILTSCHLSGDEIITLNNQTYTTIRHALLELDDITQNSTQFIQGLAALTLDKDLLHSANNPIQIQYILKHETVLSLLQKCPVYIDAQTLHHLLRPLNPRSYSIASSQAKTPNKAHLTVSIIRSYHANKTTKGGASGFLGERLQENDTLKIYVESNPSFRLPTHPTTPIIMIASGVGIAPFRAFMQEREHTQATGKNWLIFGNHTFTDDFLYQGEWEHWYQHGLLHKMSLAWSRQSVDKVYVQDKMRQEADILWQWLDQDQAYIYVCGNANKMAKGVEKSLLHIIQNKGKLSEPDARTYLNDLRLSQRYQRDIY